MVDFVDRAAERIRSLGEDESTSPLNRLYRDGSFKLVANFRVAFLQVPLDFVTQGTF